MDVNQQEQMGSLIGKAVFFFSLKTYVELLISCFVNFTARHEEMVPIPHTALRTGTNTSRISYQYLSRVREIRT